MCLEIVNVTQIKLGLKPTQDFFPSFSPAIRELSADLKKNFHLMHR